jgi:hypothetical protein
VFKECFITLGDSAFTSSECPRHAVFLRVHVKPRAFAEYRDFLELIGEIMYGARREIEAVCEAISRVGFRRGVVGGLAGVGLGT